MNVEELWNSFPPAVGIWARHMVHATVDTEFPTAYVQLCPDGYHMHINPNSTHNISELHTLLLHELSHIFRGDCLREEKDKEVMGITTDCIINHNLNHEDVAAMGGCQYVPVAVQVKLPTDYLVPTLVLYDALRKLKKKQRKGIKCLCDGFGKKGRKKDCSTAHADLIISARGKVMKDLKKEMKGISEKRLRLVGNATSSRAKVEAPDPLPLALPNQILKKLKSVNGSSMRQRSWKRPGRVELLRGISYTPRYKLLIAIDVSGSCVQFWKQLGGTAAYLRSRHAVDLSIFDTKAYLTKSLSELEVFGGGTLIQPTFELFKRGRYDALVVLTDGMLFDWPATKELPNAPIVWIIPGGNLEAVKLRDNDRLIPLGIEK